MPSRLALVILVGPFAVMTAGCWLSASPPERRTEVIGVIESWDWYDGVKGRYTLDTGDVVDVNRDDNPDAPETKRLSLTNINLGWTLDPGETVPDESYLLLAGHDPDGTLWYAAAEEREDEECPFAIIGDRIDDGGDELLFSTGLVLPKSADFSFDVTWYPHAGNEYPLGPNDTICLDRSGTAVGVMLSAWGGGEWTGLNLILPFIYGGLLLIAVVTVAIVVPIARRLRRGRMESPP